MSTREELSTLIARTQIARQMNRQRAVRVCRPHQQQSFVVIDQRHDRPRDQRAIRERVRSIFEEQTDDVIAGLRRVGIVRVNERRILDNALRPGRTRAKSNDE